MPCQERTKKLLPVPQCEEDERLLDQLGWYFQSELTPVTGYLHVSRFATGSDFQPDPPMKLWRGVLFGIGDEAWDPYHPSGPRSSLRIPAGAEVFADAFLLEKLEKHASGRTSGSVESPQAKGPGIWDLPSGEELRSCITSGVQSAPSRNLWLRAFCQNAPEGKLQRRKIDSRDSRRELRLAATSMVKFHEARADGVAAAILVDSEAWGLVPPTEAGDLMVSPTDLLQLTRGGDRLRTLVYGPRTTMPQFLEHWFPSEEERDVWSEICLSAGGTKIRTRSVLQWLFSYAPEEGNSFVPFLEMASRDALDKSPTQLSALASVGEEIMDFSFHEMFLRSGQRAPGLQRVENDVYSGVLREYAPELFREAVELCNGRSEKELRRLRVHCGNVCEMAATIAWVRGNAMALLQLIVAAFWGMCGGYQRHADACGNLLPTVKVREVLRQEYQIAMAWRPETTVLTCAQTSWKEGDPSHIVQKAMLPPWVFYIPGMERADARAQLAEEDWVLVANSEEMKNWGFAAMEGVRCISVHRILGTDP
eukprot:11183227-Lingulodinium_polyedra.AAC.1